MANGDGNGSWGAIANRLGTWAVLIGLAIYVYDIGTWVGAADERFSDARTVEATQKQISEKVTRLEANQKNIQEDVTEVRKGQKELEKSQAETNRKLDKILSKLETIDEDQ